MTTSTPAPTTDPAVPVPPGRRRRWLAAAVAAVALVGACSTDSDDATGAAPFDDAGGAAEFDGDTSSDPGAVGAGSGGGAGGRVTDVPTIDLDVQLAGSDRRIVYTGDIVSVVEDVAAAVDAARTAVAAEGGYVFAQQSTADSARVTFKVPAVRFDAAFDALAAIGEVSSRFVEAEDVSDTFVDLESRTATLQTSIARLRGFLERATDVDEISRLESELTRREAERDVIAAQLRVLDDRTSFATVTISLGVDDEAALAAAETESGPPGFGEGLATGWDAVVVIGATVATVVGFALPFMPLVLAMAAGVWWVRRRDDVAPAAEAPSA